MTVAIKRRGRFGVSGALHLHHGFDPAVFAGQCDLMPAATIELPRTWAGALDEAKLLSQGVLALWRAPERLSNAPNWRGKAAVVDAASFGEVGFLSVRRPADGHSHFRSANLAIVEAARTEAGTLALRGPMVAAGAFPPGAELDHLPHLGTDAVGFIDASFACRGGETWMITAPPPGIVRIGGYRLVEREAEAVVAEVEVEATLQQCLAGGSELRMVRATATRP